MKDNIFKDHLKLLGSNGGKSNNLNSTCIQINKNTLIDAGNILTALSEDALYIDSIFLTHSHLDHINDIPFLIDAFFGKRKKPLILYGLEETISDLKKYILNNKIWPDFSKINLLNDIGKAVEFKIININETIIIDEITKIKAIKNNHTNSSCAFLITKNDNEILFTSDTYKCNEIWDEVNNNTNIKAVITETSFPSKLGNIAKDSKHLTPELLKEELELLKRDDVRIYLNHLKPSYINDIKKEVHDLNLLLNNGKILEDYDIIPFSNEDKVYNLSNDYYMQNEIDQLIEIGTSLTNEKDIDILLEKIMLAAKKFSNADGGTLYLLSDDEKHLDFKVVQTDSLNIKMGGTEKAISWPMLDLYKSDGSYNNEMVAATCANEDKLINISDVYFAKDFNFDGTKKFDQSTGYRTKSMLVVPMKDHEEKIIGVLQLLNKESSNESVISFTKEDEKLILAMASECAITITNNRLIEELEELLDAFIKSIATAIGEKSKYTGGHINRVAEITEMIVHSINDDDTVYKDVTFNNNEVEQITRAAWLHDIGKITIPEYVVDKGKKLETIYDRFETVKLRFEILKKDLEFNLYKSKINSSNTNEINRLEKNYEIELENINNDLEFLKNCNIGGEFLADDKIERINNIGERKIKIDDKEESLLNENEIYNLSIKKGTLTNEERTVINNHVTVSYNMLKTLPFPKKFKNIPLIAGSHHKKVKGGGYAAPEILDLPMTLEDKILAVADVFEALTANDRPYKKANSLNTSLKILSFMVKDNELDKTLVKFFVEKELHLTYANKHLSKEQMDKIEVDFNKL
ncbi:MAG: HD domain-containing protein [Arcobacter sp.]|nr:HD domain-containing protein [Arcobacter sp.]